MRLDAKVDPSLIQWRVFDFDLCGFVWNVQWADDESHEYGQIQTGRMGYQPVKANKFVKFDFPSKTVFINVKEFDFTNELIDTIHLEQGVQ